MRISDWSSDVCSSDLKAIGQLGGEDYLAYFDAIAPIVYKESIDFSKAWMQSRYDKPGPGGGTADYVNCPLDQAQYEAFIAALVAGEKTDFKEWEKSTPHFECCQIGRASCRESVLTYG